MPAVLLLVLQPNAKPPVDPSTGSPLLGAVERLNLLIQQLTDGGEKVLIPTPALSEVLVYAGTAIQDYLNILTSQAPFKIVPFDLKASIEAAIAHREALERGGTRAPADGRGESRAKIKFDRQIVAIAKAEGARAVYSDDESVIRYSRQAGLEALRTSDLPLPPDDPQAELPLHQ